MLLRWSFCFLGLAESAIANYARMSPEERKAKLRAMTAKDPQTAKYYCQLCYRSFNRADHVHNHIEALHIKVKAYACQFCEAKFTVKVLLAQHVAKYHKGDRQDQYMIDVLNNPTE